MAECHPVGFQWVMEAKARGATILHVDPRFSRTSALADIHVPLRAGTDIAFLGGLIHYVLEHDKWFRDYVVHYTNAPMILREDFRDTEDLDGLFSGFDAEGRHYDQSTWQYEGTQVAAAAGQRDQWATQHSGNGDGGNGDGGGGGGHGERVRATSSMETSGSGGGTFHGEAERDDTLQHPRCVFQVLKRHFRRYTPDRVADICGISEQEFLRIAEIVTRNSGPDRTTAIAYAVGWTHHTVGVQYIRTAAILQLLLGNIGRPGGGILALRGHASIQGSTDIPTLFNILPGYLPMPHAHEHLDLQQYVSSGAGTTGFWGNMDAYAVSLLKAWWGDAATAENDFCFGYLPRLTTGHSNYDTVIKQVEGGSDGYFLVGENPAVGTANSRMNRIGLANLKWLVVRDLYMIESATFWKDGPEIESGELTTEDIGTEVFFLPAAAHVEKDGSFTNTQRLLQWHHKAVEPQGDQRSELWFYFHLGRRIREKLAGSTDERDRPILDLTWDYPTSGPHAEPDAEAVLAEISGWDGDGKPLSSYTGLKADGSTRCGCWIYCGSFADGVNQAARRKPGPEQNWVAPEWGWAWPANRRLLYNRASADPDGRPWSERKAYVWWDEGQGKWVGHDVPDFEATKRPDYRPPEGAERQDAIAGTDPFIMQADGRGWLYVPAGLADGPLPAHYEPAESPVTNQLYGQQANPARRVFPHRLNRYAPSGDSPGADVFPYVFTTYRLTEHHTAGGMSRWLPYLSELQPEMFCEVSPALAAERGLEHMGWATIVSARAAIEARVLVTERMRPLRVDGRTIHQIGLPYHWGPNGISTGDAANELLPIILDPNVHIQPTKADTCDIRPGRRPRGAARLALVESYQRRAGITESTGTAAITTDGGRRG
jgi:formate dehydrogenase major subunit